MGDVHHSLNGSCVGLASYNNCNFAISADQLPLVTISFVKREWPGKVWRLNQIGRCR